MPFQIPEGAGYFPPEHGPIVGVTPVDGELPAEESLVLANEAGQAQTISFGRKVSNILGITRIRNILHAAYNDYSESEQKVRTLSSGAAVLGVQAVGALRIPFVLVPHVAIDVLQQTGSATEAGIATAALFGAWCFTVGETLNNGMSRYPNAVKASGENFPGFVRHFSSSLPGLETYAETNEDPRQRSLVRAIGSQALVHVRRGLTAVGIGIVPYIGTAGIKNQSKSTIRKLSLALSVDGGSTVGLMSGGVTEIILKVGRDHPEIAQQIQHDAGNTKLWYGVAGSLMVTEWLKNKLKDRRATAQVEAGAA